MSFVRRWLRPAGVFGFVALCGILVLFWLFAVDWMLRVAIERGGTAVLGARVDLGSAKLTLVPMGFKLTRLQLTNPDKPMENIFELASASGRLDLEKMLVGHVIVDELTGEGLRFHTPRKYSGAIERSIQPDDTNASESKAMPDFGAELTAFKDSLPSVDEVLANEKLATLDRVGALKERVQKERIELDRDLANLPDEKRLKAHGDKIVTLSQAEIKSVEDLQARKSELDMVKKDILRDKKALLELRAQLKTMKDGMAADFAALKELPQADLALLRSRYSLGGEGTSGLARMLFGNQITHWLGLLQSWYQRVAPWLPQSGDGEAGPTEIQSVRGTGRFVHFSTAQRLPDFLVRRASIDARLERGSVHFAARDLTHQPQILGRPLKIDAAGTDLSNVKRIAMSGTLDHTDIDKPTDTLNWSVQSWNLTDIVLSSSISFPMSVKQAIADMTFTTALNGGELEVDGVATFRDATLSSSALDGLSGRVAKVLMGIRDFDLAVTITGPFTAPDIELRSNLDTKLKDVLGGQLNEKRAELEQKLKSRLNGEVERIAGPYQDRLKAIAQSENTLDQRIAKLEEMLKAEVSSIADSKKEAVKDNLKDKLKGFNF